MKRSIDVWSNQEKNVINSQEGTQGFCYPTTPERCLNATLK